MDTQIQRVLEYLEAHDLLDLTIVIISSDHGEEFMEKGRYGHNSAFCQEQAQAPLIMWVPGKSPEKVRRLTSHLDVPATLMTLLGVTNPPQDYSLGYDLFGNHTRQYTVYGSWSKLGYADAEYKAVFPLSGYGFAYQKITTADDVEVEDSAAFFASRKNTLLQIMRDMSKFSRK